MTVLFVCVVVCFVSFVVYCVLCLLCVCCVLCFVFVVCVVFIVHVEWFSAWFSSVKCFVYLLNSKVDCRALTPSSLILTLPPTPHTPSPPTCYEGYTKLFAVSLYI